MPSSMKTMVPLERLDATRDAEPEPEPPEPTHFGRSGSGSENGYNNGKITEC